MGEKRWLRWWRWTILTVPRRCVICSGKLPGGTKVMEANYRGTITLCRLCREALDKANRLKHDSFLEEDVELEEGFDINDHLNEGA